jgi:hypothetical protein
MQRQKTDDTMFLECNLLKNRLLTLYQILENKASDLKTNGNECAKCCECTHRKKLKMESEGIRAVKELGLSAVKNNALNNLRNDNNDEIDDDDNGHVPDINSLHHNHNQQQLQEQEEDYNDRKF